MNKEYKEELELPRKWYDLEVIAGLTMIGFVFAYGMCLLFGIA